MRTRASADRSPARSSYTVPRAEEAGAAARGTPLERVSRCVLCALWLDEEEQRRCELCGQDDRRAAP
jgi:hypothetical protein